MSFFSIRTNDQALIGDLLNSTKDTVLSVGGLTWYRTEIHIGDIVFIIISGDDSKKEHDYINGLWALAKVTSEPINDNTGSTAFSIDVCIQIVLNKSLTKKDFIYYLDVFDAPNIGPITKNPPNQALRLLDEYQGNAVLKAIIDLLPDKREEIEQFLTQPNIPLNKFELRNSDSQQSKLSYKLTKAVTFSVEQNSIQIPKNILFKGVPGTGKSRKCDILAKKLNAKPDSERFLRINIHSSTANGDLMQGIGVYTNDNHIVYAEKTGIVMDFIKKAILSPFENFVLVLEEIQENSLNTLIGDLIYLIEEAKRTDVSLVYEVLKSVSSEDFFTLCEKIIQISEKSHNVTIPYLIENKPIFRKMILPQNLYIFCTSNYRDDKKIIEDNLMRRFTVAEIYPNIETVNDPKIKDFFKTLNMSILKHMQVFETHPDRFIIGHALWMHVSSDAEFYKAFLKMVIDFKDIKEVEFDDFMNIIRELNFESLGYANLIDITQANSYKELIDMLQKAGLPWLTE